MSINIWSWSKLAMYDVLEICWDYVCQIFNILTKVSPYLDFDLDLTPNKLLSNNYVVSDLKIIKVVRLSGENGHILIFSVKRGVEYEWLRTALVFPRLFFSFHVYYIQLKFAIFWANILRVVIIFINSKLTKLYFQKFALLDRWEYLHLKDCFTWYSRKCIHIWKIGKQFLLLSK